MIVELYKYLTNPASTTAKKMGQLKETIAMDARYQRSEIQWRTHLTRSKKIIKKSAVGIDKKKEVIILGSGLLLDIPIDFLSQYFQHVYLVDVVHLKKVKNRIREMKNVSLIEHDVTGLAEALTNRKKGNESRLIHNATIPHLCENTGLVVSANMLSQIHLAPVYYAEKYFHFSEKELEKFAHEIISNHITMLKNTTCKVCLLTDYKRQYKNKQKEKSEEDVLINIRLATPEETWHWEIAPLGEIAANTSMSSLVYAYSDFS